MPSSTLAWLLEQDPRAELAVSCLNKLWVGEFEQHKFKRHYGGRFSVADLAGVYGRETTLDDLRPKFKCKVCGSRKDVLIDVIIHEPGFSAGGYTTPEG